MDIIDRAIVPQIPEVRNAEGDELVFYTVHYPFADGAADDIRLALSRCPEFRQENATFWNWIGPLRSAKSFGSKSNHGSPKPSPRPWTTVRLCSALWN
jgi:hypothetical protein